jgi:curved DNA-binding protein CbpA
MILAKNSFKRGNKQKKILKMFWIIKFLFLLRLTSAFEAEDYAIFELTSEIKSQIDANADFYSVLGVERNADDKTINKAYRKISLSVHPDKNSSPEAAKVYKIYTSIASTLKDPKLRKLYDKHLEKGIPRWRGKGYYYDQFEPNLAFVVVFTLAVISVAQYIVSWIFYLREKAKVQEHNESINRKTLQQVKKELKKRMAGEEASPKLNKRELKSKSAAELLGTMPEPEKPKWTDLLIFMIPKWGISKILTAFGTSKIKTE